MKYKIANKLQKVSLISFGLFLFSFPVSVSVSQIFGAITILCTYPLFFLEKESKHVWNKVQIPFWIFLGIYILLFLSSIFQAEDYSPFFKKFLKQSEFGDFWMLLIFPASYQIASVEKNQKNLREFLFISATIAILLGCISLFSEVRIGKFVANGFKYAPGDRLQHFSGSIGPIKLYLPIGMMNTHLTFGGLLGLFLPGLFIDWIQSFQQKRTFAFGFKTVLVFTGFIILFFNQSRSVWLGVVYVLLLLIFSLRKHLPKISLKTKIFSGLVLISVFLSTVYFFRNNWLIQRSVSQIFQIHNTENQRYYIYKNTIPLLSKHWLIGIGGGNYKDFHWKESSNMIQKEEQLWYELYITPRGHAHNDLLHFMITGGIFAGILFLLFWGRLFSSFFQNDYNIQNGISILTIGVLSLFPAGFFQCYLLDDEVVLPFFAFCGIFLGSSLSLLKVSFDKTTENNLQPTTKTLNNLRYSYIFRKLNLILDKFIISKIDMQDEEKENQNISHNDSQSLNSGKTDRIFNLGQSQTDSSVSTFNFSIFFYKLKKKFSQNKINFSKKFAFEKVILYFIKNWNLFLKTICAIFIPMIFYWIFWIPRLNLEPLEVYNRRVRSSDLTLTHEVQKNILKYELDSEKKISNVFSWINTKQNSKSPLFKTQSSRLNVSQASLPFQVEGCLTHRYPNPPQPRKTPFSFAIYIPENSINPPKSAKITVVTRDSFDQDQLYWAHGEGDLGTISVDLQKGKNEILIPNFLMDTTPKEFPEGVFFRDFRISYSGFEMELKPDLPKLYFGRICDILIPIEK
ncbi:O-antigen ligase family protein [Leptospira kirschneri]|uniref:O-antigen ligase family protein n=1 Tax=Leptospira kirschneri TaxID=29507 RepID=UPI0002F81A4F|nr:O-antigen ligase family protein [Leptospira kirschneri]EPG51191.1 O-antigen ligase [Leptospira kirschneri serovar Cynopteri str. 3522 CT]